jgi:hypothetical protein
MRIRRGEIILAKPFASCRNRGIPLRQRAGWAAHLTPRSSQMAFDVLIWPFSLSFTHSQSATQGKQVASGGFAFIAEGKAKDLER